MFVIELSTFAKEPLLVPPVLSILLLVESNLLEKRCKFNSSYFYHPDTPDTKRRERVKVAQLSHWEVDIRIGYDDNMMLCYC